MRTVRHHGDIAVETTRLALDSLRVHPARSGLAIAGVVIGIVTVVLVSAVLVGLRNSVAQLFRELGTDNVFVFHRNGDPYSAPTEEDALRRPLRPEYARDLARLSPAIRDVGVQLIIPVVSGDRVITARAGLNESDTVLAEGVSANFFDITGADFAGGRPFTEQEGRVSAPVAVIGANVATALFAGGDAVGRSFLLGGDRYYVVGQLAARRGTFFGENRNDNVVSLPLATARRRFPEAEETVLYARAAEGQRERARADVEAILRILRRVPADAGSDFNVSTSDQIIAQIDSLGAQIFLATVALAAVSLVVGGIGIANVMVMSVTVRTREIGLRLAVGSRRSDILRQFLVESAMLSGAGGALGVMLAVGIGLIATSIAPVYPAVPPMWAVLLGLTSSIGVGIAAGYLPARRAASLDPVEALRHE